MEPGANPRRSPNLGIPLSNSPSINVLYLTTDLGEADYLAYAMRAIAPNLHLEAFPPEVRRAAEQLGSGRFHIVLVDNSIADTDCLRLIAHIDCQGSAEAVVLISGPAESSLTQTLIAHTDDHVFKGPNFVNELADVLQRVFVRYRLGIKRRILLSQSCSDVEANPESAEPVKAAAKVTAHSPRTSSGSSESRNSDRRSSTRKQVNIPCHVVWHGNSHTATIHDLSEEGAFLEISPSPPAGTEIVIHLAVNVRDVVQKAAVIHEGWYLGSVRNFYGCGIRFRNLTEEARNILRELRRRSSGLAMSKIMLTH